MKKTQEKKKNKGLNILIVLLLTITIVASSIGLYAWAKYTSSESGEATAQVAKWHFELKGNGTEETEQGIKFPITRTDKNTTVANDRLAPGTFGQFDVIIDTTNTEVSYVYDIYIEITNCPTNLKFYANNVHTTELKTERNDKEIENRDIPKTAKLNIKRYVPVKYADATYKETIYWDWAFETLDELEEDEIASTEENDKIDTADQDKEISMNITAIGTEVVEKPEGVQEVISYIDFGKNLVGTESTSDDWEIFYQDDDNVYAILADYLPNSELKNLNIDLESEGNFCVYSNISEIDFINKMTDNTKWKGLLPENLKSNNDITVTGTVDINTFVKSWNDNGYEKLYTCLNESNEYCVGNIQNPTQCNAGLINTDGYENILYFPHTSYYNDCRGYWMSSEGAHREHVELIRIESEIGNVSVNSFKFKSFGLRPMVKLPSSMLTKKVGNVWKILD